MKRLMMNNEGQSSIAYNDPVAREKYWDHLKAVWFDGCKKSKMPPGMTVCRIEKIKPIIMKDDRFWWDVIARRGGYRDPDDLRYKGEPTHYDHAFSNMVGMIYQTMMEHGMIKP